jgi:DNA polymerase-3 subunit delta
VIQGFSGDPFLARRAARAAARGLAGSEGEVIEWSEGLTAEALDVGLRAQGLFAAPVHLLDVGSAFTGTAGVAPRNAVMRLLERSGTDADVIVIDPTATPARRTAWERFATWTHLPTPRYGELRRWVASEAERLEVDLTRDAVAAVADAFGEDLPAISSELEKLSVLEERLDARRVVALMNRPAARTAFDLIDAVAAGEVGKALDAAKALLDAGEPAARILGAWAWQIDLVARAAGLRQRRGRVSTGDAAKELGVAPFAAGKALDLAARFDESRLIDVFEATLRAEVALKTGERNPEAVMQALVFDVARRA